jgi:hypothetical protein
MGWPKHFPSGCPNSDAASASGVVYRLVTNDPPTADDFLSYWTMFPGTEWGERKCKACGLSVFSNRDDAIKLLQLPKFQNCRVAASSVLTDAHGVTNPTPNHLSPSHVTWWVPLGVEVQPLFAVLAEADEGEES